ncbi:unnamed protein product [Rotaria sp. Silwood2]|nr:unnamed protein product [Rotaria sp. Silwood2]CAF2903057.1 unnamed protein product [Rotaria sp. Silwood2]CAF4386558.1 unnamed protein product [Rotaria sp. Silwood2]CAF4413325.1 unnamed protein product [Rotaria sp. Silwood2]
MRRDGTVAVWVLTGRGGGGTELYRRDGTGRWRCDFFAAPSISATDQFDYLEACPTKPISASEHDIVTKAPIDFKSEEKQENTSNNDPFAHFRFACRRRVSSSDEDEATVVLDPPPPPPPLPIISDSVNESIFPRPIKISREKPRPMISYNHASKPICTDIYNS